MQTMEYIYLYIFLILLHFSFLWACIRKLLLCFYFFQGLHLTNLEAVWAEVGGVLTLFNFLAFCIILIHFWMALLRIIVIIVIMVLLAILVFMALVFSYKSMIIRLTMTALT